VFDVVGKPVPGMTVGTPPWLVPTSWRLLSYGGVRVMRCSVQGDTQRRCGPWGHSVPAHRGWTALRGRGHDARGPRNPRAHVGA
jgi:hypothetical protein